MLCTGLSAAGSRCSPVFLCVAPVCVCPLAAPRTPAEPAAARPHSLGLLQHAPVASRRVWLSGGDWAGASARPSSGARLGTAQRPGTASIVGAEVQITERPVTQQGGMMGMRPASAGPGRQIQDSTYYSGLLRNKISILTAEITKLRGDIDKSAADNAAYAQVRCRYCRCAACGARAGG